MVKTHDFAVPYPPFQSAAARVTSYPRRVLIADEHFTAGQIRRLANGGKYLLPDIAAITLPWATDAVLPLVEVHVNGVSGHFLVDTGALTLDFLGRRAAAETLILKTADEHRLNSGKTMTQSRSQGHPPGEASIEGNLLNYLR